MQRGKVPLLYCIEYKFYHQRPTIFPISISSWSSMNSIEMLAGDGTFFLLLQRHSYSVLMYLSPNSYMLARYLIKQIKMKGRLVIVLRAARSELKLQLQIFSIQFQQEQLRKINSITIPPIFFNIQQRITHGINEVLEIERYAYTYVYMYHMCSK